MSFSDLNKTPHILPTTLQWGCGEGVASAFLSFSERRRGRGGAVIRQCGEGLGQLSNSPVSGKSYIEGDATTPETEPATKNSNISH